MQVQRPEWKVLLIGGPSGVGKTLVAKQLGIHYGFPWLQVDDLRLSLIRSRVALPDAQDKEALYYFENQSAWTTTPDQFRDALIALGRVMSPAIEVVVESHVDTNAPLILEGDAILPSLIVQESLQARIQDVKMLFLVEPEENVLLSNIQARGRGVDAFTRDEQRTETHAKWLYGQWLIEEAQYYGLPVIESRPWDTLVERIVNVITIK